MSESRAAGWPSGAPTAAQLKEFFGQIERGLVTKDNLQTFLRQKPTPPVELTIPIEELGIGVKAYNSLKRVGIEQISDLISKTANELLSIPNFWKVSLEEVRHALAQHGLALKADTPVATSRANHEPEWQTAFIKLFQTLKLVDLKVVAAGIQDQSIEAELNRRIRELESLIATWRDDPDAY